jgi:hypothetical protein
MNISKEDLDRFAEKLRKTVHRVKWESVDNDEGSETNRESWRKCANSVIEEFTIAVIEEYEKCKESYEEYKKLKDCTIDGANIHDNTITVKLNAPNSVSGVILGSKAKIFF